MCNFQYKYQIPPQYKSHFISITLLILHLLLGIFPTVHEIKTIMRFSAIQLATLAAALLPLAQGAPTEKRAGNSKYRNPDATDVVEDSYIVVYKEGTTNAAISAHEASITASLRRRDTAYTGIGANYNMTSFLGYQIQADSDTIDEIAASDDVDYIEKDAKMYATSLTSQTGATWGLGRISHEDPGTTTYIYDSTAGSGVTVYVVDTGIYVGHNQFGGRASWGTNFVSGSADTDENGHGTHCSGTIAGSTYGVAKKANLVAVKVLDADGSGSNSGVISGIQWVGENCDGDCVLSMSLGGSKSTALNSAVSSTVGDGVTVVVAAGNDGEDASNSSPASVAVAITVGAINSNDAKPSWSNYGSILDVFAPGVDVLSSWIGSKTATNTISGTSMATPHVAGLAAYLIALEGLTTPAKVQARIKALATSGDVTSAGSGSPNLIAYNG